MSIKTKIYIGALIAAAGGLFVDSLATWSSPRWPSLALFVILAMLASLVKLGLDGTYTLNFANYSLPSAANSDNRLCQRPRTIFLARPAASHASSGPF
jgi:hypothetical protein